MLGRRWLKRSISVRLDTSISKCGSETLWVRNRHFIFSSVLWLVCSLDSRQGAGLCQRGLHLPSEAIRLALVPLPAELLSDTWQECLCWHPGRDMMTITCVQQCVTMPCLWFSDCDLEGWGWLERSLHFWKIPSFFLHLALLQFGLWQFYLSFLCSWSGRMPSWNRGRDGSSKEEEIRAGGDS